MPQSLHPTRRSVLSTAGLAAAALAIPELAAMSRAATATDVKTEEPPRLPLTIWSREKLSDEGVKRIAAISDQITVIPGGRHDAIGEAQVIFGGVAPEELGAAKKLRWVQFPAAGVEGMCYPQFVESDIVLTNAQGCYAPQIAEHAFGLLFALTRGIAQQARQRKWGYEAWPIEMRGMTMGIIGLGGIGREVARRAKGMDLHVIAVDAEPMYAERFAMVQEVRPVDAGLDWLLGSSDIVVMCAPSTARSRGMLGEKQFAAMKKGAYFINVSRGKTVVTDAMAAALKSGQLAGAGLDVTDPEPLPDGHELWAMDNVLITSHIAGRSQLGKQRVEDVFLENVQRWAKGQPLLNRVDKGKGY